MNGVSVDEATHRLDRSRDRRSEAESRRDETADERRRRLFDEVLADFDADRHRSGQFLLTGSQDLLLTRKVTESLAGRAAMLRLLPLSQREIARRPGEPLAWERADAPSSGTSLPYRDLWQGFLRGGYPELATQPERDAALWHASYVQTYLERDVAPFGRFGI